MNDPVSGHRKSVSQGLSVPGLAPGPGMGNASSELSMPTEAQNEAIAQLGATDSALLSGLDLSALPSKLWDLGFVRTLNVSRNNLTELPQDVRRLTSLTSLFLNSNRIAAVPELVMCANLTIVSIQSNRLREFPEALTKLPSLTELELQDNQLRSVPPSISVLTSLQHLNLNRNLLSTLPPVIDSARLISLNLCFNRLTALPRLLTPQLRFLTATGNRLVSMPQDLSHLSQLDVLQLDNNRLREFPDRYAHLTSVTLLDVRENGIVRVASVFHEKAPPFVYCDVPSMIQVGLFLGNVSGSQNRAVLRELGITHVVRAIDALGQAEPPFPGMVKYLTCDCLDTDEQDMRQFFERSNAFIGEARRNGGTVLVHCRQGKSRSATLVIAYLMHSEGMSFEEARAYVKARRKISGPNPSFCKQLQLYEKELTTLQ